MRDFQENMTEPSDDELKEIDEEFQNIEDEFGEKMLAQDHFEMIRRRTESFDDA